MLYTRTKRLTPNSMAGRRGVCTSSRLLLRLPHGGDSVSRHTGSLLAVSIGKTYALDSSFQLYSHHHQSIFSLLNLYSDDIFLCTSVSVAHECRILYSNRLSLPPTAPIRGVSRLGLYLERHSLLGSATPWKNTD